MTKTYIIAQFLEERDEVEHGFPFQQVNHFNTSVPMFFESKKDAWVQLNKWGFDKEDANKYNIKILGVQ
jgi:hypothetical protein